MLSIIIVNYQSSADLDICLSSIIKHEAFYRSFEFIVIDNNSSDPGLPGLLIKYPFIRLINTAKNGGFSYGNNIGINVAKGDIIFLLNPDTWVEDQSITKLICRLESDDKLDIIGPQLLDPDKSNQSYYLPKTYLTLWRLFCEQFYLHRIFKSYKIFNSYFKTYMDYSHECYVEQVSGAALMMKKRVIEKIGLLNEKYFMYFEESDFCLHAIKNNMTLLYYPESQIIHKGGLSNTTKSLFSTVCFLNSFKTYFRKNFGLPSLLVAIVILSIGTFIRFSILRITGNKKYIYYKNLLKSILKINTQV